MGRLPLCCVLSTWFLSRGKLHKPDMLGPRCCWTNADPTLDLRRTYPDLRWAYGQ